MPDMAVGLSPLHTPAYGFLKAGRYHQAAGIR